MDIISIQQLVRTSSRRWEAGGCVLGSEHRCKSGNMQLFSAVSVRFCEAVRDGSNRKIPGDGVDMTTLEFRTLALDWRGRAGNSRLLQETGAWPRGGFSSAAMIAVALEMVQRVWLLWLGRKKGALEFPGSESNGHTGDTLGCLFW